MTEQQMKAHINLRVELRQIEADIRACISQLNAYRECVMPHGISYDGVKVQTGKATADDELVAMMDKMEPYRCRLNNLTKMRIAKLDDVVRIINSLPDASERALMTDIYISNKTVDSAGECNYMSRRTAYRKRNAALDYIAENLL